MKIARTIGLAAVAAMVLTACFGGGSALAVETTLCKSGIESPYCSSENRYPGETLLSGNASDATINSNVTAIKCTSSSVEMKTEAGAGEPLDVGVPTLSFSGCKEQLLGSKCSITQNASASPASLSWTDHGNGQLEDEVGFEVNCNTLSLHCDYVLGSSLTVSSDLFFAEFSADAIPLEKTGLGCPSKSEFSATYPLSSPGPLSVARAQAPPTPVTGFCKALEQYCEPANLYPKGTEFEGTSSNIAVDTNSAIGEITCDESSLGMKTDAAYGEPLSISNPVFNLSDCSTGYPFSACSFVTSGFDGSLSRIESTPDGLWTGGMNLLMSCPGLNFPQCPYASSKSATLTFKGGHPAGFGPKVVVSNLTLTATGTGNCAWIKSLDVSGTFTIPVKDPVFVTNVTY